MNQVALFLYEMLCIREGDFFNFYQESNVTVKITSWWHYFSSSMWIIVCYNIAHCIQHAYLKIHSHILRTIPYISQDKQVRNLATISVTSLLEVEADCPDSHFLL